MNTTGFEALRDILGPNRYELKFYPAPGGQRTHFALICPGGGYACVMSCIEGKPIAQALNERGYSAFVLRYRCRKRARYPSPLVDAARALKEILANADLYNIDPDGYAVFGFSAGGHLAAMFGVEKLGWGRFGLPRPGAVVLSYPVITMGPLTHAGSRDNLLGPTPTEAEIKRCSVERRVDYRYPPTFLWCGDADKTVDPDNSRRMAVALESHHIVHNFILYQGVDHGVGLGKGLACEGWLDKAVDFWQKHIGNEVHHERNSLEN